MKFAKTFCRPSSVVSLVPVGLPLKLRYNEHGVLETFYIGFNPTLDPDYDAVDVSDHDAVLQKIKGFVPNMIPTKGGTTWIYGVLYSDAIPCDDGLIPDCLFESYIKKLLNGNAFEFYAGFVHSLAASFTGPLVIRNYLSGAKFKLLPQVVVPVNMTDETLSMMGGTPFRKDFIAGFFVFEEMDCRYAPMNLEQIHVVHDIVPQVFEDGYLKGEIVTEAGDVHVFNYSSIVRHDVEKGCTLLVEKDTTLSILVTRVGETIEKVTGSISREVKCPVCGKLYFVGNDDGPVQCDDPHCLSHLYQDACKMLKTFDLADMSYMEYKTLVKDKEILCLTDIFSLPQYKDAKIKTTLAEAMYSVIPASVAPNFAVLERFSNKCNHNVETVKYYLDNPLRIETDLDIIDPMVAKLAAWLEDPYNVSTLTTIFSIVEIETTDKKFDGAPIFRGNTIAITGKFKRGDYPEIASILRSYAANVVPSIERGQDLPDVVVTGGLNDSISGQMIQKANAHGIPIMDEDTFFTRYEIDKDLESNLL